VELLAPSSQKSDESYNNDYQGSNNTKIIIQFCPPEEGTTNAEKNSPSEQSGRERICEQTE
jgi:hypothetical protein